MRTSIKATLMAFILFFVLFQHSFGSSFDGYSLPYSKISSFEFRQTRISELGSYYDKTDEALWFRYNLPPQLRNRDLVVVVEGMNFQEIYLYESNESGLHFIGKSGNNFHHLTETRNRYNQFRINTSSSQLYFKTYSRDYNYFENVTVQTVEDYHNREWFNFVLLGIYYGMVMMSLVFNLIFYVIFRDKRFLLYTPFLFFIGLLFAYEDGIISYFTSNAFLLNNFIFISSPITVLLACAFTYYFLDLQEKYPFFKKVAIPINIASIVLSVTYLLYPSKALLIICQVSYFAGAFLCFWAAVKFFKSDPLARFLLLTLGIVLLFGLGYQFFQYGIIENVFFNKTSFKLASSFEVITISFAIIYKVKKVQIENAQFREEITKYMQELSNYKSTSSKKKSQLSTNQLEKFASSFNLTEREFEILECITKGMSNNEIAEYLFISLSTVKFHTSNLYSKLNISSRSQAFKIINIP